MRCLRYLLIPESTMTISHNGTPISIKEYNMVYRDIEVEIDEITVSRIIDKGLMFEECEHEYYQADEFLVCSICEYVVKVNDSVIYER